MKVGFFQYYPRFGDWEHNLEVVLKNLEPVQADLLVLPELAFTGYYFQSRQEALELAQDPRHSPIVEQLQALCKQKDLYLVTGFAERAAEQVFNSALLIGPEGIVHIYRKIHLFNEEKVWFDPGDRPFSVQQIKGVRVGMMVCFDWIFPEACRILALKGAQIICHPSNLVLAYCQQAMLTRCLENAVFAITANRYGTDRRPHGELTFTGQSQIVAPKGELIYRAEPEGDCLYVAEIDPAKALDKQITPRNHLFDDRRTRFYGALCGRED